MSCYIKNSFSNSTTFSVSTYHGQIFSPSVSQSCQSFLRLICIFMEQHAVRGAALYAPCQQFWVRWKRKHSLVVYAISKQLSKFFQCNTNANIQIFQEVSTICGKLGKWQKEIKTLVFFVLTSQNQRNCSCARLDFWYDFLKLGHKTMAPLFTFEPLKSEQNVKI